MGIALAEYNPLEAGDSPSAQTTDLAAGAASVLQGMGRARGELEKAVENARKEQDVLLATCLEAKLEDITALESKAVEQFRALREAKSDDAARVPFVVLTVMGQKASLLAEEAGQCVGQSDTGLRQASGMIEPPVDPNAGVGDPPVDPGFKGDGPPSGMTTWMPPVPPAASPTR